jgi:hypothetical protein
MGDPAWDLARSTNSRVTDIGDTPPAFFDGYGANEGLDGGDGLPHSYAIARAYVEDLPSALTSLELDSPPAPH